MDHRIEALSSCKVAKIPHGKLKEITERFPRLTRALWWDVAIDAAIHREWMVGMGRRSAYERIAHLLCEMLLRLQSVGLAGHDNSFDFPMTQPQLGDASGLSTVHVNRTSKRSPPGSSRCKSCRSSCPRCGGPSGSSLSRGERSARWRSFSSTAPEKLRGRRRLEDPGAANDNCAHLLLVQLQKAALLALSDSVELATSRRKIEAFSIMLEGARQRKARRQERRAGFRSGRGG